MTYCNSRSAVNSVEGARIAVSLRCRAWTCPDCADNRRRQLIAVAASGNPNRFLTLTMRRRDDLSAEEAAKRLSHAWRLCRLRLMRHYKLSKLPFLAVMEKHVSGWPHLHVLLRGPFLKQELISAIMKELVDGPNVWIEYLDKSHKAAKYVAKYCGKAVEKFATAKRYWQSRDYAGADNKKAPDKPILRDQWYHSECRLLTLAHRWKSDGWTIAYESKWKLTATLGLSP